MRTYWAPRHNQLMFLDAYARGSRASFFTILLTVNVVFELSNRELLITDYAFDKIAD